MPPVLANDQELALKKRARRRLVGAVALVLLMVIVLPIILKDRAALAPQESIKITMPTSIAPEVNKQALEASVQTPTVKSAAIESTQEDSVKEEADITPKASADIIAETDVAEEKKKAQASMQIKADAELKAKAKASQAKVSESKAIEAKATEVKTQVKTPTSFAVQVGVYSDMANVKQLQEKLKQAGYKSHVETINTPKGDKFRIRTGNFPSRQDAASALTKIQAVGLPGMVIGND